MIASEVEFNFIQDIIQNKVSDGLFDSKKAVIFGCNAYTKNIRDILLACEIEVDAIIDNDVKKQGKVCVQINVRDPIEYLSDNQNVVVIIYSGYWKEMYRQLRELGLEDDKSILLIPWRGYKQGFGDSLEDFLDKYENVKKGYEIYLSLKSEYPKSEIMFLCPYKGTGDVYMACSFLGTYLKRNNITQYLFFVVSESCKKVANMFGIQNILMLSNEEVGYLLHVWVFAGSDKICMKPLIHWGWRTKNTPYIFHNERTSFADMYRYDVFGLEDYDEIDKPTINRESTYAEELFHSLGLPKGRTVILAPYAYSFESAMSMELWEEIAHGLEENGYAVCTNCYGSEKPINATKAICFPYEEAVNVLEYAGGFIALRSGLCEIVSSANCKMVIIYEAGVRAASYDHFSIKKMGLNPEEIPIIYEKDEDINIIFDIWKPQNIE